ncbi:VOC family protein [Bacillus coahuilensis]|uniref:VOC family protein n=1 Tax=Bacillus coahuilensis TaxID=408580 RepID=UPI00307942CC
MATDPLRYEEIIAQCEQAQWTGLPKDTVMGHIHLHVAHLEEARTFYTKGLGFKVVNEYGGQALFLSTGGYHHHIGLNTWSGVGAPKPAPNSAGLDSFLLRYPTIEERNQAVQRLKELGSTIEENEDQAITFDPSGIQVILSS